MYFPAANTPSASLTLGSYTPESEVILDIEFPYLDGGGLVEVLDENDLQEHLAILLSVSLREEIYTECMLLWPSHFIHGGQEIPLKGGGTQEISEEYTLEEIIPNGFLTKQYVSLFPRAYVYVSAQMKFSYVYEEPIIPEGYEPVEVPEGVEGGLYVPYSPTLDDQVTNPITIGNTNQLYIFRCYYVSGVSDWNIWVSPALGMDLYRPITGWPDPIPEWMNPCLGNPPYYLTRNWFISGFAGACLSGLNKINSYGLYDLFESEGYINGDGINARACLYGGYTHRDSTYRGEYFLQRFYDTCSRIVIQAGGLFQFNYTAGVNESLKFDGYVSGAKPTYFKYEPLKIGGGTALQTALATLSQFGFKFPGPLEG